MKSWLLHGKNFRILQEWHREKCPAAWTDEIFLRQCTSRAHGCYAVTVAIGEGKHMENSAFVQQTTAESLQASGPRLQRFVCGLHLPCRRFQNDELLLLSLVVVFEQCREHIHPPLPLSDSSR